MGTVFERLRLVKVSLWPVTRWQNCPGPALSRQWHLSALEVDGL